MNAVRSSCIVTTGDALAQPSIRSLAWSLADAGHDVVVVAGIGATEGPKGVRVVKVPGRHPQGWGPIGWLLRRLQPEWMRSRLHERAVLRAAKDAAASFYFPSTESLVGIASRAAEAVGGVVVRRPAWGAAGSRDAIDVAPVSVQYATSPRGEGLPYFTPEDTRPAWNVGSGRHTGRSLTLAYSGEVTSPGSYLERALERAGVDVTSTRAVDWEQAAHTGGVVFVESPYPPATITGSNPGIPTLFWVHHGEHHLEANLRLVRRYRADAVLLAHSWHLAPRFPVPVHRFPFAVDPDLFHASRPMAERTFDAAMVAADIQGSGGRYSRRQTLAAEVTAVLGEDRVAFLSGISPSGMADVYRNAKIVLNDGGTQHYPITMRVFEAIGSGAVLLTDDLPGLDVLFDRGRHYVAIDDVGRQAATLARDPARLSTIADAGFAHASGHHTYDHRVDELFEILDATTPGTNVRPTFANSPLAQAVSDDVEVQSVAAFGVDLVDQLPSRAVEARPSRLRRLRPRTVDAVVIGDASVDVPIPVHEIARRYVYAPSGVADALGLRALGPTSESPGDVVRLDLGAPGYRADQIYGGSS